MVSSGANVIIWCYHVMLSSGIFPENFTHSKNSTVGAQSPGINYNILTLKNLFNKKLKS
jgi:hypothetical protein